MAINPLQGLLQAQQVQSRYPGADDRRLRLEQQLAQSRLGDIVQNWQQFPGRAPGGSGLTGLHPADKFGWSDMLNEQTEALQLQSALSGKGQPNIQVGPNLPPANRVGPLQRRPSMRGLQNQMPETHEAFMGRYGR